MGVLTDLRYAVRGLSRNRGFALAAILSLAFGIGANTTIFTLIRAVFLRPLPVRDPARVTAIFTVDPRTPGLMLTSYPNYRDYRDHNTVFSGVLLYTAVSVSLTGRGDPQLLMAQLVSGNYFDTLGVQPAAGRGFVPQEDASTGSPPVAVIGHALWSRVFAADPRIVGRTIELNGRPYTIVGVTPEGFTGINQLAAADVFLPLSSYPAVHPLPAQVASRGGLLFLAAGRLKAGITMAQAESAMNALAQELARQFPNENRGRGIRLTSIADSAIDARTRPTVTRAGAVLMTISALVLLIGCGNVANLLLARAAGRNREIALRLAVGAPRARLVRQLVMESLLLAAIGGACGLMVARWARDLLWSMRGPTFRHANFDLAIDPQVLLFNAAIALATGIIFGLAPALYTSRADLASDLKDRAGGAGRLRRVGAVRSTLVMAQVSLAIITLIGASLFLRSLLDARRIDPGFDAAHLGVVAYNVNDRGYSEARGRDYHQRALERAASVPGVIAVTISRDVPFRVSGRRGVLLEGELDSPSTQPRPTLTGVVWPGYLRAVGIPLLRGRDFSVLDGSANPRVAIVNEAAAAQFWPGENPLGKRIRFSTDRLVSLEVVGVARTANYQSLAETPQPFIYLSLVQYYFPTAVLYVRTAGDPAVVVAAVRRALQSLDPSLLLQAETINNSIGDLLWAQRLSAWLLGAFGALALLLAMIGIYGVIAYSVRQRRRELGIRMALGATPGDLQFLVLGEGIRLIAMGAIGGSIISLAFAGTLESLLFLPTARDMFSFTMVPAMLTLVGVLACWAPAVRSSRIDPSTCLRDE